MPEVDGAHRPVVIAAFDFDGTLTQRDTLLPFLVGGLGWPQFLLALLRCSPWLLGYALRLVPNHVAKAKLLQLTLGGRSASEMEDWTVRWMAGALPGQLRPWAMERLAWHQQSGHCCVLVSASPDVYLTRVAERLGFDALLCTRMEVQGTRLTGRMNGANCHGEEKVARVKAWALERFGLEPLVGMTIYAYGDTPGDKPMLRLAQHAWYRGKQWGHAH